MSERYRRQEVNEKRKIQASIKISIDELVLLGFSSRYRDQDRKIISMAAEQQLNRLISENGLSPGWDLNENKMLDDLDINSYDLTANSKPRELGKEIGTSLYAALL